MTFLKEGTRAVILEKGSQVGSNVSLWKHVRLFSPWKLNVSQLGVDLLASQSEGKREVLTGESFPTGEEYLREYLFPVVSQMVSSFPERLQVLLNHNVTAVGRRHSWGSIYFSGH